MPQPELHLLFPRTECTHPWRREDTGPALRLAQGADVEGLIASTGCHRRPQHVLGEKTGVCHAGQTVPLVCGRPAHAVAVGPAPFPDPAAPPRPGVGVREPGRRCPDGSVRAGEGRSPGGSGRVRVARRGCHDGAWVGENHPVGVAGLVCCWLGISSVGPHRDHVYAMTRRQSQPTRQPQRFPHRVVTAGVPSGKTLSGPRSRAGRGETRSHRPGWCPRTGQPRWRNEPP